MTHQAEIGDNLAAVLVVTAVLGFEVWLINKAMNLVMQPTAAPVETQSPQQVFSANLEAIAKRTRASLDALVMRTQVTSLYVMPR